MMWNYLVSGLAVGATVVLFDGDPASPDLSTLWRLAAETGTTYSALSAPFLMACRKAGLEPGRGARPVRGCAASGRPARRCRPDGFRWVCDAVSDAIPLGSLSGGTDVCTAFVGAVAAGARSGRARSPCRLLGARSRRSIRRGGR